MRVPYFFITAFLWMSRVAEDLKAELRGICEYLRGYRHTRTWIYLHGQMLPLSHVQTGHEEATWSYAHHQLTRGEGSGPLLRMGWLSAKLACGEKEYDMDAFFERLRIRGGIPSLHLIFLAWCAETSRWLAPDQSTFHVIDEDGQDRTYRTDESLHIHGRRLYVSDPTDHNAPILMTGEQVRALFPSADPYTFYHA